MKKIISSLLISLFAVACSPMDAMHENMQSSMQCGCCQEMKCCADKNDKGKKGDMSQCCCQGMMDGKNSSGKMCLKKQDGENSIVTKIKAAKKAKTTPLQSSAPTEHNEHHK